MNRGQRRAEWLAAHRSKLSGTRVAPQQTSGVAGQTRAFAPREHMPEASKNAPQASAAPSVRVHIEELVLHGFPANSRYSIGDATQQELTRLLTERGVPQRMSEAGETARVNAGSFQVKQDARPNVIGALVANAVYGDSKR
jgi:hypothetical protein